MQRQMIIISRATDILYLSRCKAHAGTAMDQKLNVKDRERHAETMQHLTQREIGTAIEMPHWLTS